MSPRARTIKREKDALILPAHLTIDTLIDVGVAGGTAWLYDQYPDAKLLLIDPLGLSAELEASLNGRNFHFHACALGARKGAATLNIDLERPSMTSLLSRTALTRHHENIQQIVTPIQRLDDLAGDPGLGRIGLKIDTEGYELEVLRGAEATLNRCAFILCEVSLAKRFEESYSFSELVSWLHGRGFGVSDIMRVVRRPNAEPLFADILFERQN